MTTSRTIILSSTLVLLIAAGGGTAWALDRFVVEHVEIADVSSYEADNSAVENAVITPSTGSYTATSYESEASTVTVSTATTGTGNSTVTYYVADVVLSDATVLRSAFANNQFGTNIVENTSVIAAANDAVLAINGDYYGFRDSGIVIRNGVTYRDSGTREGLAFYLDGTVEVYDEAATTAADLLSAGVWNTLSFGPAIVQDGVLVDGIENVEVDTNVGNHSIQGDQPRTAIGVIDANHLVFVVVDGRSPGYSAGVTLPELAAIFTSLGAVTAYNLDGGGSSTMVFNDTVVNNPLGAGVERATSDILYVAG